MKVILEILDELIWQPLVYLCNKAGYYAVVPTLAALKAVLWCCKILVLLCVGLVLYAFWTLVLFIIFSYVCDQLTYVRIDGALLVAAMMFACVAAWKAFVNATDKDRPLYRNIVDPASRLRTRLLSPGRAKVHQQRTKK